MSGSPTISTLFFVLILVFIVGFWHPRVEGRQNEHNHGVSTQTSHLAAQTFPSGMREPDTTCRTIHTLLSVESEPRAGETTLLSSRNHSTELATRVQRAQSPRVSATVENACCRKGV